MLGDGLGAVIGRGKMLANALDTMLEALALLWEALDGEPEIKPGELEGASSCG